MEQNVYFSTTSNYKDKLQSCLPFLLKVHYLSLDIIISTALSLQPTMEKEAEKRNFRYFHLVPKDFEFTLEYRE